MGMMSPLSSATGMNRFGRHQSLLGMLPAQQGLDPHRPAPR